MQYKIRSFLILAFLLGGLLAGRGVALSAEVNSLLLADFLHLTGSSFLDEGGYFTTKERLGMIGNRESGLPIEIEWSGNGQNDSMHKVLSGWSVAAVDACVIEESEKKLKVLLPTGKRWKLEKVSESTWSDGECVGELRGGIFHVFEGDHEYIYKDGVISEAKSAGQMWLKWERPSARQILIKHEGETVLQINKESPEKTGCVLQTVNGPKKFQLLHDVRPKFQIEGLQPRLHFIKNLETGGRLRFDYSPQSDGFLKMAISREKWTGTSNKTTEVLLDESNKVVRVDNEVIRTTFPDERFTLPLIMGVKPDGSMRLIKAAHGAEMGAVLSADASGITRYMYATLPTGKKILRKVTFQDLQGAEKTLYIAILNADGTIRSDASNGFERKFDKFSTYVTKDSRNWTQYESPYRDSENQTKPNNK